MKQKAENDRYKNVKIFEYQNYNPEQLKQNKISENKNTENNATLVNEKLPPKKQTEQVVEKPEIKQNSVPKQPKVPQTPQRPTQPQRPQAPQKPKQHQQIACSPPFSLLGGPHRKGYTMRAKESALNSVPMPLHLSSSGCFFKFLLCVCV